MSLAGGPKAAGDTRSQRFHFWRISTVVTLLVGYMGYYLCRANLDAALPLIGRDLSLTKTELGAIATISVWFYALGKFTHGFTTTLIGGKAMFVVGLAGAAVFCAATGLAGGLTALIVLWSLNRFIQAGGWIGMVQVTAQWFKHSSSGSVMAILSLSYLGGDALAKLLSGGLVEAGYDWRTVFFVPAAIVAVMTVVAWFTLKSSPEAIDEEAVAQGDDKAGEAGAEARAARFGAWKRLFKEPSFWMYSLMSITLTGLRLAFLTWSSTYILSLGASDGAAMAKSSVFPLAGIAGILFAGFFSDFVSKGQRGPVSIGMLALLTLCLVLMGSGVGADSGMALVLVGVVGFMLLGPYSLIAGAAAIDFGGREAAGAAASFFDGIGYLFGAVLGGVGMGAMAESLGWTGAFMVLAGLSGLTIIPAFIIWTRERARAQADAT